MSAPPPEGAALAGRMVLVAGLGASGVAAARALLAAGARVLAADGRDDDGLRGRAAALAGAGADVRLGGLPPSLLDGRDLVIASPGVPPSDPLLLAAVAARVPVWSEPELAWRLARGRTRLVAVTGTNGKTTTTELVAACLGAPAAGNIGTPLVELIVRGDPPPLAVAELSSFQLHFAETLRPDVAVLVNVAPDHLDWHGSLTAYGVAKARLWARQRAEDWAVVNADDPGARRIAAAAPPPGGTVTVSATGAGTGAGGPHVDVAGGAVRWRAPGSPPVAIVPVDTLRVRGAHNLDNVCAAAGAAIAAGADPASLAAPLAGFQPGAHRLEHVARRGDVDWVNDSKATNPHAARAALASFDSVVWIAGGLNKGLAFDDLVDVVRGRVRAAITIGECGPQIAALTRRLRIVTVEAGTLDVAVAVAAGLARSGDTVLLAPAAASMDQFVDYADRGRSFRDLVTRLDRPAGAR